MFETELCDYADKLANFIRHKALKPITQAEPYYHMGATITDSILQAGMNYKHVVYPRILKLLKDFPGHKTTSAFILLMQAVPLTELVDWKNEVKLQRINNLSRFLFNNNIEDEDQFAIWLNTDKNVEQLKQIKGIGPKTVDYLKMLSGNQAIAIDRHLFAFLEMAGILIRSYDEANLIYSKTSELLNMSKNELDKKIWLYMSKG
jgi:endonuclease III